MKIMNFDYEMRISAGNVSLKEDYGVIESDEAKQRIGEHFRREVDGLYIVEDCECRPTLMVDWRWWLSEDDQFTLLRITCDEDELDMLRSLGIL